MSTNATEDVTGRDDGYESPLRPEVGEMGEEPAADEPAVGWLPDADEETVKYLSSRGWDKDPMGAIRSQKEAERKLRDEQNTRAKMESEMAEMREAFSAINQPQATVSEDPFGIDAAADAYENGEIDFKTFQRYNAAATLQAAQQIAEEIVGQRVQPLQTYQTTRTLQETAAQMAETYSDFPELSEKVLEMIEKRPDIYGSEEGMKAAYGLVRSERDAEQARERRSAQDAETLDSGSRGSSAQDAAEAVRAELRRYAPKRDGF